MPTSLRAMFPKLTASFMGITPLCVGIFFAAFNFMEHLNTLSQMMNALRKKGYTCDLSFENDHLKCNSPDQTLAANDIEVDEIHRFEGMSNPGDSSILYAVSAKKFDLKGLLVHAYGAYAQEADPELIKNLDVRR